MKNQLENSPDIVFHRIVHTSLSKDIDSLAAYLLHCMHEAAAEKSNPTLGEIYELNIRHLYEYLNLPLPALEEVEKRAQILAEKKLIENK